MAHVLEDGRALPGGWTDSHAAGLDIYRNTYRARLVGALRETYERTAKWVGDDGFRKAAAHHLIHSPPCGWTLDDAGHGFSEILAELFADNPEVAELAWLEWAMHRAYVAADVQPMTAADFERLAASFSEDDWGALRIVFLPGTAHRTVRHDITALWTYLDHDSAGDHAGSNDAVSHPQIAPIDPASLILWREGEKPVFMAGSEMEGQALQLVTGGASYGEMCAFLLDRLGEAAAIAEAGAMFGRWLHNGLIASVSR